MNPKLPQIQAKNKPTSACCGAEIDYKATTRYSDGREENTPVCTLCFSAQTPASKGEDLKGTVVRCHCDVDKPHSAKLYDAMMRGGFIFDPSYSFSIDNFDFDKIGAFIQTAIDEAVREATEGVPLPFLPDRLQRKYVDETVQRPMPNPHSPNAQPQQ